MTAEENRKILLGIPYYFFNTCLFFFGVRLNYLNDFPWDLSKKAIYIFNHSSNIDPLMALVAIKGKARVLGKAEILDYPFWGYALKNLYVSVDRNNESDRSRSLDALRKVLKEGESILIFPEGTRNKSAHLLNEFHKGAFQLSIETNTPIVMMSAINSKEIIDGSNWWIKPGTINCHWDGPFLADELETYSISAYKEYVFALMHQRMMLNDKERSWVNY